jgi:hypothetical protein
MWVLFHKLAINKYMREGLETKCEIPKFEKSLLKILVPEAVYL